MSKLLRAIRLSITIIAAGMLTSAYGQATPKNPVREYIRVNQHEILGEFFKLLSLPNVASDTENINRNARFLKSELEKRGLKARLLTARDAKVPPAVYGEWGNPAARRTVVFYAHYDGQPVDPERWTEPGPWTPVLRTDIIEKSGRIIPLPEKGAQTDPEWRVYARSASDDKGGVFTILKAIDALKALKISPAVNVKIFFEGEEEAGSSNLKDILGRYKELLDADAWIICDGPVHQSGQKQVVFGVRGVTSVDLTVYGANRDLHSGHYGNWSPNPGFRLAKLLSSMRDSDGRVVVKGWYDDVEPLGKLEVAAIESAPQYDADLREQLGLSQTEGAGKSLLELINLPSLNINGMKSGDVGRLARNVIPATANAVIGLRLVKGNDQQRQVAKLKKHIESQGYYVTDREPTAEERLQHPLIAKFIPEAGGYNAQRTRMDLPVSLAVIESVKKSSGAGLVTLPTLGGSLPLSIISDTFDGVATITVPIANYDNNQHAADENIRIGNLWEGIEIYADLMTTEF